MQSPFLSALRVAFHFRFSMPGDKFCNIDRMADITCPVFLVHGTNDEVVPFWNGQELYLGVSEEFRYRPFWVQGEYFKRMSVHREWSTVVIVIVIFIS